MKPIRLKGIKQALQGKTAEDISQNEGVCERCIVCRRLTDIPVSMPVSERKCYVPGGGQLCRKCCMELYGTDDLRSLQSAELEQMFFGR